MGLNKDRGYYYIRGVIWLLLATIISFGDEFIKEYFGNNGILIGISTIFVLLVWGIFVYYTIRFFIKSKQ